MRFHLFGVVHADPLGRTQVIAHLRECGVEYQSPPALVAVEWGQANFLAAKAMREQYKQILHSELGVPQGGILDELARSFAFEGDCHRDVFPDAQVLWLDEGRRPVVFDDASAQVAIFREALAATGRTASDPCLLEVVSGRCWERVRHPHNEQGLTDHGSEIQTQRDAKLAQVLLDQAPIENGNWVAVVIGAAHAGPTEGSTCDILRRAGHDCGFTICDHYAKRHYQVRG